MYGHNTRGKRREGEPTNFLASCSDVVRFWDASSVMAGGGGGAGGTDGRGLELRRTCNLAAATTNCCSWNHSGSVIATGGDDGSVTVLRLDGIAVPAEIRSASNKPILGIAFSKKSRILAAGGEAGVVEVWHLNRNSFRVTMTGHRGAVSCVSFLDQDTRVAAGDERGRVLLHKVDAPPEEEKSPISLPPAEGHEAVTAFAMSPMLETTPCATLGVSHADGSVRLWDVGRGACLRELTGQHRGEASGIAFHPRDPSMVATVGSDGFLHCADLRVGGSKGGHGGRGGGLKSTEIGVPLTCVTFHHEGLTLATGASDGTIRLVDLRTARSAGRPQNAFVGPKPPKGGVRDLRFQLPRHHSSSRSSGRSNSTSSTSSSLQSVSASSSFGDRKGGGPAGAGARRRASGTSSASRANDGGRGGGGGGSGARSAAAGLSQRKKNGTSVSSTNGKNQRPASPSSSARSAATGAAAATGIGQEHHGTRHPDHFTAAPSSTTPSRQQQHWSTTHSNINNNSGNSKGSATAMMHPFPASGPPSPSTTATVPSSSDVHRTNIRSSSAGNGDLINSSYVHLLSSRGSGEAGEGMVSTRDNGEHATGAGGGEGVGREFETNSPPATSKSYHRDTCAPHGGGDGGDDGVLEVEGSRIHADGYSKNDHSPVATTPRGNSSSAGTRHGENGHESGAFSSPSVSAHATAGAGAGAANRYPSPSQRLGPRSSPERNRWEDPTAGATTGDGDSNGRGWPGSSISSGHREYQGGRDAAVDSVLAPAGLAPPPPPPPAGDGNNGATSRGTRSSVGSHQPSMSGAVAPGGAPGRGTGEGREDTNLGTAAGGGPVAGGQIMGLERSVLEQMLSSHMSGLKDELRQEIRNLHVDVLRQFHSLQDEQAAAMSGFEERLGGLVAENQALRAENDRLRRVY